MNQHADLILLSNAIFDSVHDEPFAGGVAVKGDKILFVGGREETMTYCGEHTDVRDFGDRLISPGFCVRPCQIDGSGRKVCGDIVKGLDNCRSEEECIGYVVKFAQEHPGIPRIYGTNWMLPSWRPVPKPPTRHSLDKYFPDTPVYLVGADGHSIWLIQRPSRSAVCTGSSTSTRSFPRSGIPWRRAGSSPAILRRCPATWPLLCRTV